MRDEPGTLDNETRADDEGAAVAAPPDLASLLEVPPMLSPLELARSVSVSPLLVDVESALLAMWRDDPEGRVIAEHRALMLGRFAGYLEGVLLMQPSRLPDVGALYTRLVQEERRAWADEREARARSMGRAAGAALDLAARG